MKKISGIDAKLTNLPPSQFKAIRQLVIAALHDGTTVLTQFPLSADARVMITALQRFGWKIRVHGGTDSRVASITVNGGIENMEPYTGSINLESSGLAYRLSMLIASLGVGPYRLIGDDRMSERTVADLEQMMKSLEIAVITDDGFPPVTVRGSNTESKFPVIDGGEVFLSGSETSQFHTAVLLGFAQNTTGIRIESDTVVSQFYVEMTRELVQRAGVEIAVSDDFTQFEIPGGQRFDLPPTVQISSDLMMVSYFFFLTALIGGELTIALPSNEQFNDCWILPTLQNTFGCDIHRSNGEFTIRSDGEYTAFDINGNAVPFLVPTLGVLALTTNDTCYIRNVDSSNNKMTARKNDTVPTVLRKMGAKVTVTETDLIIDPTPTAMDETITITSDEHKNDHRIVMSLALLLCHPDFDISVENMQTAVSKSFLNYRQFLGDITEQSSI